MNSKLGYSDFDYCGENCTVISNLYMTRSVFLYFVRREPVVEKRDQFNPRQQIIKNAAEPRFNGYFINIVLWGQSQNTVRKDKSYLNLTREGTEPLRDEGFLSLKKHYHVPDIEAQLEPIKVSPSTPFNDLTLSLFFFRNTLMLFMALVTSGLQRYREEELVSVNPQKAEIYIRGKIAKSIRL